MLVLFSEGIAHASKLYSTDGKGQRNDCGRYRSGMTYRDPKQTATDEYRIALHHCLALRAQDAFDLGQGFWELYIDELRPGQFDAG